ncbi:polyprenyl synthetase family protein [Streptomyces sp. NBC_01571]|uniref:polyprenyl synthetase family protein n=1 Tax=Streptomyces sp. NBC_01571 TaxID=2975883 RepID=UPI00225B9957|nr:polyprenyl synthetase family protein [Streptomyces sp. NBC_01571]MCX4577649.1 polyprenyl synthetase family protein [Streptomyces sp. NBC_01571]
MTSAAYLDLHQEFSSDIEEEIESILEGLGPSADSVRSVVTELLCHQRMKYPLSVLPLVVHGVETGSPEPAVPLSAVHVLWWTSACYLDDLADGYGAHPPAGLTAHEALLAAVVTGHVLSLKAVGSRRFPEPVRAALTAEILDCGITAAQGQLGDIRAEVGTASRNSVLTAYREKSGAPFGMITAMAAILAGAEAQRIDLWREFGSVFGVLWQMFNDQEDIASERNEDLLNGTATYLSACALEDAAPDLRHRILDLHAGARTSAASRSALAALLLTPAVLDRYEDEIHKFRDEAHRILGDLGGDERYLPILRQLVDRTSRLLLRPGSATG